MNWQRGRAEEKWCRGRCVGGRSELDSSRRHFSRA